MIRRKFYGWRTKTGEFRLSLYPPDSPVRPSVELQTMSDVQAYLLRKRGTVYWWPPLPYEIEREIA